VMVDLPAGTATAADFEFRVSAPGGTWVAAPAPLAVAVRRNAGANLSDRVHVVWTDGAIRNRWLRVTVKANPRTGLAAPDVFQFGNLVGEAGDGAATATATATAGPRVSALDLAAVKRALNTVSSPVTSRIDFDRDGRVNASDLAAARSGLGQALATPPPPPPAAPAAGLAVTYVTREVLDDDQRPNGLA